MNSKSINLRPLLTVLMAATMQFAAAQVSDKNQYLQHVGVKDSIYSQVLNELRTIYIQLPEDYHPANNKRYAVAYILDGEVFLPTLSDVQSYYSGGFTPEMVLVGVSNEKNRTRDLTISKITKKYGMPFNEETGGAEKFSDFLETELIPFIERKYRTTEYRTLIGHSYGGLFTIFTLINKPYLFANYLAIDPSLDWNHQEILTSSQTALSHDRYSGKSLFVSMSGQLHMQDSNITLGNVMLDTSDFTIFARSILGFKDLVSKNDNSPLNFSWKYYPNDLHGTIPFPSLMDGLVATFQWFQMEQTHKINSFDTPIGELHDIVRNREWKLQKNFGYHVPPYPEELLNMSGYMNMDMEQLEKAKMYFEFAIEYYPESPNVYDSMADYYEAQGDIDSAIKYVSRAAELSDDIYYKNRLEALRNQ